MITGSDASVELPLGLVTLVFTDIEGSTKLLHELGDTYGEVLVDHQRLLRAVWRDHRGVEVNTEGDAFFVAFSDTADAVTAAQAAQRALRGHSWPGGHEVRVRIGVHLGTPKLRDNDYWGIDVHYAARICAAAHGGQVLLSDSVANAVSIPVEDLGMHALKDFPMPRRLFHLPVDGVGSDVFPDVRTLRAGRTNLPDQLSSLVGREREVDQICTLVEGHRMVTLAGPGGVGKTRLMLRVGAEMLDGSGDGVWLAELAGLVDATPLVSTVARALSVQLPPDRPALEVFAEELAGRRVLLILDNCEHLLDAVAELTDVLLRRCPSIHVLATSREPLGLQGEVVYRVPSLDVPSANADVEAVADSPAVRLLLERAAERSRGFSVDSDNAASVAAIARRLDGIPLAIELAAAWLQRLSVAKLSERLDRGFDLLSVSTRGPASRQQTIRALVDWSYELLSPDEQKLLNRLSVFAGGFDLAATEAICGDSEKIEVVFTLAALVDKSLVQVEDTRGELRYRLLETVRSYAAAKLDEMEALMVADVRDRHLDHFLGMAEAMHGEPDRRKLAPWLNRVEVEHDNMRAALNHAFAEADPDRALRLATALTRFRHDRGYSAESTQCLTDALALPGAERPTRARAAALVELASRFSFHSEGRPLLEMSYEAFDIARSIGDGALAARALLWRVYLLGRTGEWEDALEAAELALSIGADALTSQARSRILVGKAGALINLGRDARPELTEAAELSRRIGDPAETARVLNQLGLAEVSVGEYRAARATLAESREIATRTGLRGVLLVALVNLGLASYLDGDGEEAGECARAALEQCVKEGDQGGLPYALLGVALSESARGQAEFAARLHGAVDALFEARHEELEKLETEVQERDIESLRRQLGRRDYETFHRQGAQCSLDEMITAALRG